MDQQTNPHQQVSISEKNLPVSFLWVIKRTLPSLWYILYALFFYFLLILIPYQKPEEIGNPQLAYIGLTTLILAFLLLIPFTFIMNLLNKHHFHFSFDNQFITIQQGILSKYNRQIHYGVIQNIVLKQEFSDRLFKLATIVIQNAAEIGGTYDIKTFWHMVWNSRKNASIGFSSNEIIIPGLSIEHARYLQSYLLERIKNNKIQEMGI